MRNSLFFCLIFILAFNYFCEPAPPSLKDLAGTEWYEYNTPNPKNETGEDQPYVSHFVKLKTGEIIKDEGIFAEEEIRDRFVVKQSFNFYIKMPKPQEWFILDAGSIDISNKLSKFPKYITQLFQPGETIALFISPQALSENKLIPKKEIESKNTPWHNFILVRLNTNLNGNYGYALPLPKLEDYEDKIWEGPKENRKQVAINREGLFTEIKNKFLRIAKDVKVLQDTFVYRNKKKYEDKNSKGYPIDWGIGYQEGRSGFTVEIQSDYYLNSNDIQGSISIPNKEGIKNQAKGNSIKENPNFEFKPSRILFAMAAHPKAAVVFIMVASNQDWDEGLKEMYYGILNRVVFNDRRLALGSK